MLESLDAAAVHRWCAVGLSTLRTHQREIDDLNVYPVPDGDTGTNLVLTIAAAYQALAPDPDATDRDVVEPGELTGLGRALAVMARGALLGARGNSGVILAQLLQGLADALAVTPRARGRVLAGALAEASASAYRVVADPAEGTVLTVARGAAEAAARADTDDLAVVVTAAAEGAAKALALTPTQLPALARAGVVDAGGRGLVLLLEALVEVVTGARVSAAMATPAAAPRRAVARETGSPTFGYEVQYLLDAPVAAVERLRQELSLLGDSLVLVNTGATGGELRTWNVHVHVNDVGAAIEAGIEAGRPHRISVTRFADQFSDSGPTHQPGDGSDPAHRSSDGSEPADQLGDGSDPADYQGDGSDPADHQGDGSGSVSGRRAVLAVADGPGLRALFQAGGARPLPGRPGTAQILAEVEAAGGEVVLLPNDPDTHAAATAAADRARAGGVTVAVLPTRSPVQGLAALAVRDPARDFAADLAAMGEAADGCRYAEVVTAAGAADTAAGRCRAGDALGLVDGVVRLLAAQPGPVATDLLDLLLGEGGELVTVVFGAAAPAGLAEALREHLTRRWPGVEAQLHVGGQSHQLLLLGVE